MMDYNIFPNARSSCEEKVLWTFEASKKRTLLHSLKYVSIGPIAWILLGLCLAASGVMLWQGMILFVGVAIFTYVISSIALLSQKENIFYIITDKRIAVNYPAMVYEAKYANIKSIAVKRSVFNKNIGTICFKVKRGISLNYQFALIDDVDEVYNLLMSLLKNNAQSL